MTKLLYVVKNILMDLIIYCKKFKTLLLDNIYIYQGNVHQLLDEYCGKNSISEVWILFPDPWPKKDIIKED